MTENAKLYPIGTVVRVQDVEPYILIVGHLAAAEESEGYVRDYSGVQYPKGVESEHHICMFDHAYIEEVISMGYQDAESFESMKMIQSIAAEMIDLSKKAQKAQEALEIQEAQEIFNTQVENEV